MEPIKVKIDSLCFPSEDIALRPQPKEGDKDYDQFLTLKGDIAERGLLSIFSVSPREDGTYMVIDGSRRATAVKQLYEEGNSRFADGEIYVQIRDDKEWDALESMIAGNSTVKATPNTNYIKSLQRLIIARNYSIDQLAIKVGMSRTYIESLLKLNYLPDYAKEAIDKGQLSLSNAIQFNKLEAEDMEALFPKACSMTGKDFAAEVAKHVTEKNKAKRAEKSGSAPVFEPSAKYMAKGDAYIELERAQVAFDNDPNPFNEGYLAALKKVFGLDDASVEAQKAEFENKLKDAEEKKIARAKEREAKKIEEAQKLLVEHGIKIDGIN